MSKQAFYDGMLYQIEYQPQLSSDLTINDALDLTINETLTLEQFLSAMCVTHIDVMKNPKTGELYFTYGNKVGGVAGNRIPTHPLVSEVCDSNFKFLWVLHEAGQDVALILASY